ncbi:MAG: hypothetical protein J2P32_06855 [Actinobacteria bacterium]|nr:hypothetical protein [Actinomycetota bacterium]
MTRKRRLGLTGVIPAALLVSGVTGVVISLTGASPAAASQKSSCSSSGGLLSAVTSTVCKTLNSTTGTVKKVADGATGGATSGATSAVKSTVGSVGGAVNSAASGSGGSSTAPSGGSSSGSSGSSTGASGSTVKSNGGSQQTGSSSASGGSTSAKQPASVASPLGATYRAVVLAELLRKLGLGGAAGSGAMSGTASDRQASLQLPTVKPSSNRAVRVADPGKRVSLNSTGSAARLSWLLIAVAAVLAGGIGLVYTGWRNADLIARRRREDRKPARPGIRFPVPAGGPSGNAGSRAVPAPRPAPGPRPAMVDLRTRRPSSA